MKRIDIKNKSLWGISMIGLLGISYWLCRYTFLDMHGMKQWPDLLAILSITIIVIATIFGKRLISASTVIGYMGGFIFAMTFNTYGIDQGGSRTNNAWQIWGSIFGLSILIGIFLTFIIKKRIKV